MIRTQIQLTETQSQQLKKIAAMRDTSVAQLIRFTKVGMTVIPHL